MNRDALLVLAGYVFGVLWMEAGRRVFKWKN